MDRDVPCVVVGAGIVGACISYQLARAGLPVVVLDSTAAVPPATLRSFAWLGDTSSGNWPGGAEDLRPLVLDDHRRLAAEVPGTAHRWTGSLSWPPPLAAAPGQRLVDQAEVAALEPHLRSLPDSALHIPTDGGLDPLTAVPALLRAAQDLGARFLPRTPYSADSIPPDATVIFAAGSATPSLAGADLPVTAPSAFGMRVAGPAGLVRHIVATADFQVREVRRGRYLLGTPWTAEYDADALAERCLERFRETFRVDGELRTLAYGVVKRPMPASGPIVGPVRPGRYVAVLHAGVTFAPTVGRLIATELRTGEPVPELHRCRP